MIDKEKKKEAKRNFDKYLQDLYPADFTAHF